MYNFVRRTGRFALRVALPAVLLSQTGCVMVIDSL
jgi:hypothetical protein